MCDEAGDRASRNKLRLRGVAIVPELSRVPGMCEKAPAGGDQSGIGTLNRCLARPRSISTSITASPIGPWTSSGRLPMISRRFGRVWKSCAGNAPVCAGRGPPPLGGRPAGALVHFLAATAQSTARRGRRGGASIEIRRLSSGD
jgi:hypothetical protein